MSEPAPKRPAIGDLPDRERVRARAPMFIGNVKDFGLLTCVEAVIAPSLEEALQGRVTRIDIRLHADGSISLEDDGAGPITFPDGEVGLRGSSTSLHGLAVRRSPDESPLLAHGPRGLTPAFTNFLSSWFEVSGASPNGAIAHRFENGNPDGAGVAVSPDSGTRVHWLFDWELFDVCDTPFALLRQRLRLLAGLIPEVSFTLSREADGSSEVIHSPRGVAELLEAQILFGRPYRDMICIRHREPGLHLDVAMTRNRSGGRTIASFVNHWQTTVGGSHVDAVLSGVANEVSPDSQVGITSRALDVLNGLWAVIALRTPDPVFEGPTRGSFCRPDLELAIRDVVRNALQEKQRDPSFNWLEFVLG